MKITFVTALYHVVISDNLGRGDKLDDVTYISNDKSVIENLVPRDAFQIIGKLEYDGIINAKSFIYSIEDFPESATPESYLLDRLYTIQSFLSAAWIAFDNNINFEVGFVFYTHANRLFVSSNHLAVVYSSSQGNKEVTHLNRERLRQIRALYREKLNRVRYSHENRTGTQLLKENSRIEVALYHIQSARATNDIGLKISGYCSALESLFSTSQTELAHQLSERLAFFISDSSQERLEIYKKAKQAYGIRSKVVHGASIKKEELEKVKASAYFCDSCLRKVIFKLISEEKLHNYFSGKNDTLDEYMLKLIFGVHQPSGEHVV